MYKDMGTWTAGAWGTDTGRNLVGSAQAFYPNSIIGWQDFVGALYADDSGRIGNPAAAMSGTYPRTLRLDASRLWGGHAGTEFAPVHIRLPVVLYLGKTA